MSRYRILEKQGYLTIDTHEYVSQYVVQETTAKGREDGSGLAVFVVTDLETFEDLETARKYKRGLLLGDSNGEVIE